MNIPEEYKALTDAEAFQLAFSIGEKRLKALTPTADKVAKTVWEILADNGVTEPEALWIINCLSSFARNKYFNKQRN